MTTFYVELTCTVSRPPGALDNAELEALGDRLMVELMEIAENASVGLTLPTGRFELSITVDADGPEEAVALAAPIFRSALHAAEVPTPGWRVEFNRSVAEQADLIDA